MKERVGNEGRKKGGRGRRLRTHHRRGRNEGGRDDLDAWNISEEGSEIKSREERKGREGELDIQYIRR